MKSAKLNNTLLELKQIVKKLRSPNGCDWDKQQTHSSLIPYLIEETYEVVEAIENRNYKDLKEELGDLLLHIVFQADLSDEENKFTLEDCLESINNKLVKRHAHIFYDENESGYSKGNWESSKQEEKQRESILDGIPKALPALLKANRIQEKAASAGFDWNEKEEVLLKVDEELDELKEAISQNKGIEEELGDLFFSLVNLSRHLNINPEKSLNSAINKFSSRFKKIEKDLKTKNIDMKDLPLDQLDDLWEENKKKELK